MVKERPLFPVAEVTTPTQKVVGAKVFLGADSLVVQEQSGRLLFEFSGNVKDSSHDRFSFDTGDDTVFVVQSRRCGCRGTRVLDL